MFSARARAGLVLATFLIFSIIAILALSDLGKKSDYCAIGLKYIPCLLVSMQDLSGGLIGTAGAIFAAWLAWSAFRPQLQAMNLQSAISARSVLVERIQLLEKRSKALTERLENDLEILKRDYSPKTLTPYWWATKAQPVIEKAIFYVSDKIADLLENEQATKQMEKMREFLAALADQVEIMNETGVFRDPNYESENPSEDVERLKQRGMTATKQAGELLTAFKQQIDDLSYECDIDIERLRHRLNGLNQMIENQFVMRIHANERQ